MNRLLVVGFYLLTLGFVVLAMRPSGQITSVRQAAGVLSVKIGEVLLVLGALHLMNVAIFRRIRRRPAPGAAERRRAGARRARAPRAGQRGAGRSRRRFPARAPSRASARANPRTYIDHCGRA